MSNHTYCCCYYRHYLCCFGLDHSLVWVDVTGFDNDLAYCSDGKLVCVFLGFCCVACCVTVFICISSGPFKMYTPNSLSRCDTIRLYVPFSKCTWLFNFFRWRVILAYMICSRLAWAATPNAYSASFCSSSRKSFKICFTGLNPSRWNLCFAVSIERGLTYLLRNTVRISHKFSILGWWFFLKVCSASPPMIEWK